MLGIDNTLDNYTCQRLVEIALVAELPCMVRVAAMTVQRSPEMELMSSCTQDERAVVTLGTAAHEAQVEGVNVPSEVPTSLVRSEA